MALDYFSEPTLRREQHTLFHPTLDEMIGEDHPVRILDELMDKVDLSAFEQTYHGSRGQPPISPRLLAKVLIYCMSRRIRSSRQMEYALGMHIDLMWLAECRVIDHSTLCRFRKEFGQELKSVFRQLGEMAMRIGLARLNDITFDGTRVRANNGRYKTLTAKAIEERLNVLVEELGEWSKDVDENDRQDNSQPKVEMPAELLEKKARQKAYQEALATAKKLDEHRRKYQQIDPRKNPAQVPMTDGDSRVMPNKEGGYAPNYSPTAAVDVHGDFIVDVNVLNTVTEHTETLSTVDRVEETFGTRPETLLADSHHATGSNIATFNETETELISPLAEVHSATASIVNRPDPTVPVPESQWPQLPISPQGKTLDKSCFQYDEATDTYYCPQGQPMPYECTKYKYTPSGQTIKSRTYRCDNCASCPLFAKCVSDKSKAGRTVSRDEFTEEREAHAAKMATEARKEQYEKRFHSGEVIFAYIKHVLGVRQFLLRGLPNVKTEWLWACTTYNMIKMMKYIAKLRLQFAAEVEMAVE